MNLTPEQIRENADAYIADADGKPFEVMEYNVFSPKWREPSSGAVTYLAQPDRFILRPKPEPKVRPWSKPEDVPGPVCWVRSFSGGGSMVLAVGDVGLCVIKSAELYTARWIEIGSLEYSTDRKTWKPCTVEEA